MRICRVLVTPWVATPRSARWLFVFVLVLVALADVLGNIFGVAARAWVFNAILIGVANAMCWLVLLPNGLLLAMSARRLRLPGISRDAVWSLPLYAALGIGVPMMFQLPSGQMLAFAVVQMLIAVGAMLFMVLPYYLVLALYGLFLISHRALSHFIPVPGVFDPRFVPWGGMVAIMLLVVLAWRWRQLLHGGYAEGGLRAPGMVFFRRNLGGAHHDPLIDAGSLRVRPDWMLVHPDLRGAGPKQPAKSLRLALGGVYLPQTMLGRLYGGLLVMLLFALMGFFFFAITFDDHSLSHALSYVFSHGGFRWLSWLFAVFGLSFVVGPVELLTSRWGQANAELPLLALLPNLSQTGHSQRLLLRAVLAPPAAQLGLLVLVGWVGVVSMELGSPIGLAMLAVAGGCLGYLCAMVLSIFGGHPLSGFGKSLLLIGMFVLLSLTMLLPQLGDEAIAPAIGKAEDALVVAWLALALFLLWLGRSGWHELQQRPHPFLPN